ncbi:hypothetical protein AVEN_100913-1 [Araneus ventricosus]|uniref:Uncharacterized protein n=1 Tax=Araneus ventricosus TaxID=182803 RepID=A0A4Y2AVH6_ARAVE|nr:hypothetical protein AVEN_100913-1 [Araneus ventricosus]
MQVHKVHGIEPSIALWSTLLIDPLRTDIRIQSGPGAADAVDHILTSESDIHATHISSCYSDIRIQSGPGAADVVDHILTSESDIHDIHISSCYSDIRIQSGPGAADAVDHILTKMF